MPYLTLSRRAQADMIRLHAFLELKNPSSAAQALLTIRESLAPLKSMPLIGRPVMDSNNLRELVIGFGSDGYIALYEHILEEDRVYIVAIKHQKEDDYYK